VPVPGPPAGAYSRPSQFYTAYARGKNVATAVDVINFFINDEAAGAALGTERGLPPSSKVSDAISAQFTDQLKYVVAFDKRIVGQAGDNPPVPAQGDSKMNQLMVSAGENAGFGRKSPQEAAAEFVSQATSELERAAR
jgi:multiple sugar transport system substrate-binding protein